MSTYDPLYKIIPPDQALANKALEAALQQVKGIFNSDLNTLGSAVGDLASNINLDLINALTQPLPPAVLNFWQTQFVSGTGYSGTLRLVDIIGTPSGWIHTDAFNSTTDIILALTANGSLNVLTNGTNGVYTVMENCLNGLYTSANEISPGPPPVVEYQVTIPPGLPGAGIYGTFLTAEQAQADAFTATGGLNQALISAIMASRQLIQCRPQRPIPTLPTWAHSWLEKILIRPWPTSTLLCCNPTITIKAWSQT